MVPAAQIMPLPATAEQSTQARAVGAPDRLASGGSLPGGLASAGISPEGFARFLPIVLLVGYACINWFVISPAGNFPLNDDWIYSESVQHLLQTGQFHLIGCAPSCFLHVAIGAALCALTGFSHEALRALTTCFAAGTVLLLYGTTRKLGINRPVSTLVALALAMNPLFVNVSYSFMTDVPAMFFGMLSMYWLCVGTKRNSLWFALGSGIALCAAILVRQTFAAFVLGNIAIIALDKTSSLKFKMALLAASVIAPVAVAFGAEQSMTRGNEFLAAYTWYKAQFANTVKRLVLSPLVGVGSVCERLFQVSCYLAAFCLPVIALAASSFVSELRARSRGAIAALTVSMLICVPSFIHTVVFQHRLMPFSENLLRIPMVGPINLMGICVAALKTRQRLYLTIVLYILAIAVIALLVQFALTTFSRMREKSENLIPAAILASALGLVIVQTIVLDYDRYYLMALPAVLIAIALCIRSAPTKLAWVVATVAMIALGVYSTASTQDYLSWNRARWDAIRQLETAGVPSASIDGGPEYNYWSHPDLIKACVLCDAGYIMTHRGEKPMSEWRWWPVNGEDYIVAFNTIPNYDVIAQKPYFGALTMSTRQIYVLKRH